MPIQTIICLIIFILAVVSYIVNKIPMAMTALVAMFLLIVTGCVDASTALGNFANSSAVIMACMFVVAAGLNRTQMVNKISGLVYKVSGGSFTKGLAGYVLVTFLVAQVVQSSIVIFSICFPLVANFCKRMNVSPSKAMFSIGLVSVSCLSTLPIGTAATNYITANTLLETYGSTGYEFGMLTTMWGKLPMVIAVLLLAIFVIPRLAPDKGMVESSAKGRTLAEQKPLGPVQEVCGYGIFLLVVVLLILNDYIPLTQWQVCMGGALLTVITGVLGEQEAVSKMNLSVVFLYVGGLTMGQALVATGAGELIGNSIVSLLGEHPNSYVVGLVFFLVPFLLTQVMNNNSVMQTMRPITIMACVALGYNPIGPYILTSIACTISFLTPMATPTIPLMMSVGGYSQKDLFRMGWLPAIVACAAMVLCTMTLYPCY